MSLAKNSKSRVYLAGHINLLCFAESINYKLHDPIIIIIIQNP